MKTYSLSIGYRVSEHSVFALLLSHSPFDMYTRDKAFTTYFSFVSCIHVKKQV